MQPFALNYPDLSGGLNLGPQPADIADNEQSSLKNLYPVGTELRMRPGFNVRGESYAPDTGVVGVLTSLHIWRGGTPSEVDYFAGATESIARWNHATGLWERVPRTDALGYVPYATSLEPWQIVQYHGIMYFFRRDVGMRRVSRGPYQDSPPGIPSSTLTAPTLTSAGAGSIPAADFQGAVTFYNTVTDAESNPSPYSVILAHPGGTGITWTGLPITAPVPQVNAIRLYRTLPDEVGPTGGTGNSFGAGAFYRVATLTLGTVTFQDTLLVDQLGPAMKFDNHVPPGNLRGGAIHQERLWTHDGRSIFVSPIGHPESVPPSNQIQVSQDDNQELIGLAADELRLYVGKSRSVVYFAGSLPNLDRQVLDNNHGVVSQHTMRAVSGRLIWRSNGDVLISEGGPGRSLTPARRLRTYMDNVVGSEAATETAAVWPERSLYLWLGRFTQRDADELNHPHDIRDRDVLMLNYDTGAWGHMRLLHSEGAPAPTSFYAGNDEDGQPQLFLTWGAYLLRAEEGLYSDRKPAADASLSVQAFDVTVLPREATAPPAHQLWSRHLWLDSTLAYTGVDGTQSQFDTLVYRNGQYGSPVANGVADPVVSIDRQVRQFPCQPGNAASKLLVGVRRRGIAQSFDVFGLGWSGAVLARRHRPEA